MFRKLSDLVQALFWLLSASRAKNAVLRMFGHTIGNRVVIGPNLVLACRTFDIGDDVVIGAGNVLRGMNVIALRSDVRIGSRNWVSAHPGYQQYSSEAGQLTLGAGTYIASRHYLDCSGAVVGERSAIAGQRSTLQTHEIDLMTNETTVGRITIRRSSFVGTGCIMLRGSALPSRSLLAAGSTLTRSNDDVSDTAAGLWGGSPARFVKAMPGKWFDRDEIHVDVVPFDAL